VSSIEVNRYCCYRVQQRTGLIVSGEIPQAPERLDGAYEQGSDPPPFSSSAPQRQHLTRFVHANLPDFESLRWKDFFNF
jgi:hypothetical protein